MSTSSDRRLRDLSIKAEGVVSDVVSGAFDMGYEEGFDVAEDSWVTVASKFGCFTPEELEAWYNDMLTRMAEVMNEQELQS